MARKAFSIHSDFYGELSALSSADRGQVVLALIAWAEDGEIPPLPPVCAMLFRLMKAQIERVSSANAFNGTKGGRPIGKTEKSEESEGSKKKPSVSGSDTDTVSVSDSDAMERGVAAAPPSTRAMRRFTRPTVEQVAEYCRQRKNHVDAQHFVDYYEANGWRVGKNPMKDWMAAVRTWERNGVENPPHGHSPHGHSKTTNPFVNLYRKEHGDESG